MLRQLLAWLLHTDHPPPRIGPSLDRRSLGKWAETVIWLPEMGFAVALRVNIGIPRLVPGPRISLGMAFMRQLDRGLPPACLGPKAH